MTDTAFGAPQAHPFEPNQRPPSACQSHIPTSRPQDRHGVTPGVVPVLLPRPEAHSP